MPASRAASAAIAWLHSATASCGGLAIRVGFGVQHLRGVALRVYWTRRSDMVLYAHLSSLLSCLLSLPSTVLILPRTLTDSFLLPAFRSALPHPCTARTWLRIVTMSCSSSCERHALSAATQIDASFSAARSSRAIAVNMLMPPCSASRASDVVVCGAASRHSTRSSRRRCVAPSASARSHMRPECEQSEQPGRRGEGRGGKQERQALCGLGCARVHALAAGRRLGGTGRPAKGGEGRWAGAKDSACAAGEMGSAGQQREGREGGRAPKILRVPPGQWVQRASEGRGGKVGGRQRFCVCRRGNGFSGPAQGGEGWWAGAKDSVCAAGTTGSAGQQRRVRGEVRR
eukprot:349683-Chlamydomonas_euryale.AAC.2